MAFCETSAFSINVIVFGSSLQVSTGTLGQRQNSVNHTCSAGVVRDAQWVAILVWVNREQTHSKRAVLRKGGTVLKVLQVNPQLVVGLNGKCVDSFHA